MLRNEVLDGVLQADAGAQDPVLVEVLVWQIDVGNWPRVLELADYALRHQLKMPDQYNRDLPAPFNTANQNGIGGPNGVVKTMPATSSECLDK